MSSSPGWTVKTLGSLGSGSQAMWTQRPGISSRVSPGVFTPGAVSTLVPRASLNIGPVMPGSVVTGASVVEVLVSGTDSAEDSTTRDSVVTGSVVEVETVPAVVAVVTTGAVVVTTVVTGSRLGAVGSALPESLQPTNPAPRSRNNPTRPVPLGAIASPFRVSGAHSSRGLTTALTPQ